MRRTLTLPMNYRLLLLLVLFSTSGYAQNWSKFLDSSRAIDWASAGFTIPTYTTACSTQPSLTTGSGAASANATSINNAVASCNSTHNVVNIPAGTWYVTAIRVQKGQVVLRGAGPGSTTLIPTTGTGCAIGLNDGICVSPPSGVYAGNPAVLPPSGTQQCAWTAGYAQGTTSITLNSCGGAPLVGSIMILDQANYSSDTSGVYICDTNIPACGYEGTNGGNDNGRFIAGATHSEQQLVYVSAVSGSGSGPYTVTISPGVFFTNIRSGQSPGAWWFAVLKNVGIENLTINGDTMSSGSPTSYANIGFQQCYQCWAKNVANIYAGRDAITLYESFQNVVRDGYFYGSTGSHSDSYSIEWAESSNDLVENNIFQQVTTPIMFGAGTGNVVDYNFSIYSNYSCGGTCPSYVQQAYESHNAGNNFNLFEGNVFLGIAIDDAWGASGQDTYFRNMLYGWQSGKSQNTVPIMVRSYGRTLNIVGNVLGQPGYHNVYQTYATSAASISGSPESNSIYVLGLSGQDSCGGTVTCDPRSFSTLMRWGNYDTVNAATQWNSTEASPAAVPYVNANFTSSYFSSLAHTLPNSLYYSSQPSWWPSSVAWPSIGPDVTTGNVGECSGGTYAGAQAISSSQCTGGTLSTAWATHVNAIPAQVCYLSKMSGPPDGSGNVLSFDASQCYASSGTSGAGTPPAPPTGLAATVN